MALVWRLAPLVIVVGVGIPAPGWAQNLDAGKTPAQLFASNCQDCHRSPRGLAKNANSWSLSSFLRVHYTTGSREASALAAYVLSLGQAPEPRRQRRATTSRPKEKAVDQPADDNSPRPPGDIKSSTTGAAKPAGEAPAAAKTSGGDSAAKPAGGNESAKPDAAPKADAAPKTDAAPKAEAPPAEKPAASAAPKSAPAGKPTEAPKPPAAEAKPAEGAGGQ